MVIYGKLTPPEGSITSLGLLNCWGSLNFLFLKGGDSFFYTKGLVGQRSITLQLPLSFPCLVLVATVFGKPFVLTDIWWWFPQTSSLEMKHTQTYTCSEMPRRRRIPGGRESPNTVGSIFRLPKLLIPPHPGTWASYVTSRLLGPCNRIIVKSRTDVGINGTMLMKTHGFNKWLLNLTVSLFSLFQKFLT